MKKLDFDQFTQAGQTKNSKQTACTATQLINNEPEFTSNPNFLLWMNKV